MKMRVFIFLAIALCACAAEVPQQVTTATHTNDKRQTQEGTQSNLSYRTAKSQEQGAPVEENQDDDKGLRKRTSVMPTSDDQSSKVEASSNDQPLDQSRNAEQTTETPETYVKNEGSTTPKQLNIEVVGDQSATPDSQKISIEHRGLSLEDRRKAYIPPPSDGISYTPEEFTSLVVAGFAVTPIPAFDSSYINPITTVRPPTSYTPHPSVPVTSTVPPPLYPVRDPRLNLISLQLSPEQYRQKIETLPPPKNSKFYTPEEYNGLLSAGYPVTAVPVNPLNYVTASSSRGGDEEYRPGQVFSLNPHELLELQPERKAPVSNVQLLQQLYGKPQLQEKQNNYQQLYYLDPQSQTGRQVPPSHAVIARPHYSFNGGEASVGAALSVSDTGATSSDLFDQEILALLSQTQVRPERLQAYSSPTQTQQISTAQSAAPQYQQVDRYVSKPSKKTTKTRSKVHVSFPQPTSTPQQYLIETTNVHQQQQQQSEQPQYRPNPQLQRLAQALRYVPISQPQQEQFSYERPESQGLKIVAAPKLQQLRPQYNYSVAPQVPQYQSEATPKKFRIVEFPRPHPIRQELRISSSNIERPVSYLKRYPDSEKQRSVKIYDPIAENVPQQSSLAYGEQFALRNLYRTNEPQRPRYELPAPVTQERVAEATKPPHSAIYVSKNLPIPRRIRPHPVLREQSSEIDQVSIEQHGHNLEEQRSHLPPPKNNRAYTPEEFAALVAAGYSVTPVPVSALSLDAAQSRISEETVTSQPKRRLSQWRRNQYLPVRDDAP